MKQTQRGGSERIRRDTYFRYDCEGKPRHLRITFSPLWSLVSTFNFIVLYQAVFLPVELTAVCPLKAYAGTMIPSHLGHSALVETWALTRRSLNEDLCTKDHKLTS
jgi:hypothetical protein